MDYAILAKNLLLERTCDNCKRVDSTYDGDCCRNLESEVSWTPISEDNSCDQWKSYKE